MIKFSEARGSYERPEPFLIQAFHVALSRALRKEGKE
jgi:hypothetical protein